MQIVEFYAPWCGHCQNLKPAYEKVATSLKGLAKVAAVNCDEENNKPLCGQLGVQGFPTLKIVRPSKKAGKPTLEDYQGARTAKAIADAVAEKITNHVKRVQDKDIDAWLKEGNSTAKAILFSEKGTTSALVKSLAIDFLGSVSFAQIRNTQKEAVSKFGVDKFPRLVLLPGGAKDGIVYDGEMKREPIVAFLTQVAEPNPDPAPAKPKQAKKKDSAKESSKSSKASSSFSAASASHASSEAASPSASIVSDDPLESPDPKVQPKDAPKPIQVNTPPMIEMLENFEIFQSRCLTKKSPICFLALLPEKEPEAELDADSKVTLASLGSLQAKASGRGGSHVPFYSVPFYGNNAGVMMRSTPDEKIEIVALNAKKKWLKRYSGADGYALKPVESWVDSIKMGEGQKEGIAANLEKEILAEPKIAQPKPGDQEPIHINLEDLMKGQGADSPLKVEVLEELPDHDEL